MIKNQNLYEKILDNLYEGVYIVDKNRKIIFWNKSAERITGFKNFEVLGKRCSENILIHINEKGQKMCDSKKLCPLEKTIIFGKIQEEKIYLSHKDGQRVPVFLKVFPIVNKNKKIIGATLIKKNDTINKLLKRVDSLMYQSKKLGKNRVSVKFKNIK